MATPGARAHKLCTCCGAELPLSSFFRLKASRDGHQYICKQCSKAQHRKWYAEKGRAAYMANADKLRAYQRDYQKRRRDANRR